MNVPDAWDIVDSTQSVIVGVYDSAFDYADDGSTMHEDLVFEDVRNNKPRSSFTRDDGHGTHVAGILAGQHNNNCGISSVATNTRLYAYACSGSAVGSSMGDNIAYATLVGSHVKVINVSLGMGKDIMFAASRPDIDSIYATKAQNKIQVAADILEEYLGKLVTAGYDFVICTSAGNTNDTQFVVDTSEPYDVRQATKAETADTAITKESGDVLARWDCALTAINDENLKRRIIVVGSIANAGSDTYTISNFSNIGDRVDVMVPGSDILSSVPVETDPSHYRLMSGTGMASPAVASVVAMMYQVNPALRAGDIKDLIRSCSTKSVTDGTLAYPIPNAVECYTVAANAPEFTINDSDWPTGIICGYTNDDSNTAIANVQFTAIRKSTGDYNLSDYSFQFSSDDEYRIVLTWGSTPSDLDSHLTYYNNNEKKMHVYYSQHHGYYNENQVAVPDPDDTTSYGPETITIHMDSSLLTDNSEFRYSVHDYSDGNSTTTTNLAKSNAVVHLYKGNTLLHTYHVPQNGIDSVWHVFDIDSTGVHPVNSFYGASAGDVQ